jgi:Polyketide cyclase / dehydrase and lipid transport
MFAKEKSIHVEATPEAVFDYVSDIHRHPEWARHPLTMREMGVGKYESTSKVMHLEPRSEIQVETVERPRPFTYLCDDNVAGKYRWHFDIAPAASGTTIKYGLERLRAPLWVRLVQPWLLWPMDGRVGVLIGLANIKRALESSEAAPSIAT